MNIVSLIGRLTREANLSQTLDKKVYATLTLDVKCKKKTGDTGKEADFIPCIIFGKTAENLTAWTTKGTRISLEEEVRTRFYEKK